MIGEECAGSVVCWCALATVLAACSPPAEAPYTGERPNFVFVLADDLDLGVYHQMPRLAKLLDAEGTTFGNSFVSNSICCPSRATILRGQYSHNTQIFTNAPRFGGFERFYELGDEKDTIATWLASAGYRTVLYGKYLNGYPATASMSYVPPGWSEWYGPVAGTPYDEMNYSLNENGTVVEYGEEPEDFMIDLFGVKSADFIDRAAADGVPFFVYMSVYAPHTPATAAARYNNDYRGVKAPRTAAFNEADMSDKPKWLRYRQPLDEHLLYNIDILYSQRLKSMEAVEDLVQSLVDSLARNGILDKTYIIFTSDNGFHQGQHRLPSGKYTEFDEDLFVPLIVRGPNVPAGRIASQPIINVDHAPTLLELAHVKIPSGVDGRSYAPLLFEDAPIPWRTTVFLEHIREMPAKLDRSTAPAGTLEPPDSEPPINLPPPRAVADKQYPPPFWGIRTDRYTYVEIADGDIELYDHYADPLQLDNLAATADKALLDQLSTVLHGFRDCNGASCRRAEEADVP